VRDEISGRFDRAIIRFFIHPDLSVSLTEQALVITGKKIKIKSNIEGKKISLSEAFWSPKFGKRIPNKVIEIEMQEVLNELIFEW
jgi:hypothetical protein